jgi:hypothetical protein
MCGRPEPRDVAYLGHEHRGEERANTWTESQEIGQVLGVTGVILHSAVAPVVAERMSQVNLAAELFEQVGRPVPPITRFNNYLGVLAGAGHRPFEGEQVTVVDVADF